MFEEYIFHILLYNAESPKQVSKRFNSITKTIHFAHLYTFFYLSMARPLSTFAHYTVHHV